MICTAEAKEELSKTLHEQLDSFNAERGMLLATLNRTWQSFATHWNEACLNIALAKVETEQDLNSRGLALKRQLAAFDVELKQIADEVRTARKNNLQDPLAHPPEELVKTLITQKQRFDTLYDIVTVKGVATKHKYLADTEQQLSLHDAYQKTIDELDTIIKLPVNKESLEKIVSELPLVSADDTIKETASKAFKEQQGFFNKERAFLLTDLKSRWQNLNSLCKGQSQDDPIYQMERLKNACKEWLSQQPEAASQDTPATNNGSIVHTYETIDTIKATIAKAPVIGGLFSWFSSPATNYAKITPGRPTAESPFTDLPAAVNTVRRTSVELATVEENKD